MLEVLQSIPGDSIEACITDPPYDIGFMSKQWDRTRIAFDPDTWRALFRVLKPGAHALIFGGTRTYHRITCAVEDAGFEIRDCIMWLYGSGFPKSLDVGKAIDKSLNAEREISGISDRYCEGRKTAIWGNDETAKYNTAPSTDLAKHWNGWGTALKPAYEIVIIAQKPLDLSGHCDILAQKIGRAICQLSFHVKDAENNFPSNLKEFVVASNSALWPVVQKCNSLADLFVLMDTLQSESAVPLSLNIGLSWLHILAEVSNPKNTFTTETTLNLTTELKTLNCLLSEITPEHIIQAARWRLGIESNASIVESILSAAKTKLNYTLMHSVSDPAISKVAGKELHPNYEPDHPSPQAA